ncbi:hypothetical protein ACEPAF_1443 [Sanghuangporus sanghuang]
MLTSRILAALLALLFAVVLLIVFAVLLMPRSLVRSRVCLMPLQNALFSEVCSRSTLHAFSSYSLDKSRDAEYARTLGIATSIYVVSLARRTDRRRIMDLVKGTLDLDWVYFDALDKEDDLVDVIMHSVANQRTDSASSVPLTMTAFSWPDTLEDVRLESLGAESHSYGALRFRHTSIDQLVCATGDNTIPTYANVSSIPFHMRLSRGMIACWYSHVELMAEIVRRTAHITRDSWDGREGVSVVFEDDVDVEWDLKKRVARMWRDLPRYWDIVMLGHCWSNESTNPPITPSSALHPSHKPKCTHGYVLSPFGARNLLMHLTYPPFAFSRALDQAIAHLIRTRRIQSYSVVPSIVVQRRCPRADSDNNIDDLLGDDDRQKNVTKCRYSGMDEEGDSDIWVSGGKQGSRWRDSLVDSALEHIWKSNTDE